MIDRNYQVTVEGTSRSFPPGDPFLEAGGSGAAVLIVAGDQTTLPVDVTRFVAVVVELGEECLEVHRSGSVSDENLVGFARWRLGDADPTDLVELVALPGTSAAAVAAGRAVFESAGMSVSVCQDRAGRIVDRLIRPQFNLALRAVDDGLASEDDLDTVLVLGLGYRHGVLAPVVDGGLEHHHAVSSALHAAYGTSAYVPARQAVVARDRAAMSGRA